MAVCTTIPDIAETVTTVITLWQLWQPWFQSCSTGRIPGCGASARRRGAGGTRGRRCQAYPASLRRSFAFAGRRVSSAAL